jgi:hypothetical protein
MEVLKTIGEVYIIHARRNIFGETKKEWQAGFRTFPT